MYIPLWRQTLRTAREKSEVKYWQLSISEKDDR